MSDDTPTQRFEPSGGDTPTERFDATTRAAAAPAAPVAAPAPNSRRTLIILIIIGVILLLAVLALLGVLLARGAGTPTASVTTTPSATASETPSATPTPSPTPTPTPTPTKTAAPPADNTAKFTDFTYTEVLACVKTAPAIPAYVPSLTFHWATKNAVSVWYVNGTSDAADSQFLKVPASGDQDTITGLSSEVKMNCHEADTQFTITLVGADGKHVSKTGKVHNGGDIFP